MRSGLRAPAWWTALIAATALVVPAAILEKAPTAEASSGAVTAYADPSISRPGGITVGPDGALWFTNVLDANHASIGRITPTGVVTSYPDPSIAGPRYITAGPDGALWFTNQNSNSIGRITTSGTVTNYTDPTIVAPIGITVGPDGALWFTNLGDVNVGDLGSIGRITTTGIVTNYRSPSIDGPEIGITAGSDGALWFTNGYGNSIGRITTSGIVTNYTDRSIKNPGSITAGPDGALWFTNDNITKGGNSIGRITTTGVVTNYADPTIAFPFGITTGADGALWFTNLLGASIGRITTGGVISEYTDPSLGSPEGIAAGPDGSLWFTNSGNGGSIPDSIGRITTSVNATPTWTIASSPYGKGSVGGTLTDVSCVSAVWCMAVGSFGSVSGQALIQRWNGETWSVVASPDNAKDEPRLSSVACVSAVSCHAVGSFLTFVNGVLVSKTLVESWNGRTWTIARSPNPGTGHNELVSVACVSAGSCTAVGTYGDHSPSDRTLVESWNGHVWSVVPSPNPGTGSDELLDVSCVARTRCIAVGNSRTVTGDPDRTLVESWNGKKWFFVPSPNRGAFGGLQSVSCVSATSCEAIGSFTTSANRTTALQVLTLSWNGRAWSLPASPTLQGVLNDVSCISVDSCTAVGDANGLTLVESWNGRAWSLVKSPSLPTQDSSNSNELLGVACLSATSCEAVGDRSQGSSAATLVEAYG